MDGLVDGCGIEVGTGGGGDPGGPRQAGAFLSEPGVWGRVLATAAIYRQAAWERRLSILG